MTKYAHLYKYIHVSYICVALCIVRGCYSFLNELRIKEAMHKILTDKIVRHIQKCFIKLEYN